MRRRGHTRTVVLALGLALGRPAAPAASAAQDGAEASEPHLDLARQRFARGVELYKRGQTEEALGEFEASTALYASPNAHLYAGHCHKALGRLPEAVAQYERSVGLARDRLQADPRYAATLEAASEELRALEPRIGRVRLEGPPLPAAARVTVGDRALPGAAVGLAVPVRPGRVEVEIAAPGHLSSRQAVTVVAGRTTTVLVDLRRLPPAPPPPDPNRHRPWMWASLSIGAAGLGAFGVFYALARSEYAGLDDRCTPRPCTQREDAAVARGRTYQTLTNVSLGVGAAGLATGALLWWLLPGPPEARVSLGPGGVQARF